MKTSWSVKWKGKLIPAKTCANAQLLWAVPSRLRIAPGECRIDLENFLINGAASREIIPQTLCSLRLLVKFANAQLTT
jgi:hypothetical protein